MGWVLLAEPRLGIEEDPTSLKSRLVRESYRGLSYVLDRRDPAAPGRGAWPMATRSPSEFDFYMELYRLRDTVFDLEFLLKPSTASLLTKRGKYKREIEKVFTNLERNRKAFQRKLSQAHSARLPGTASRHFGHAANLLLKALKKSWDEKDDLWQKSLDFEAATYRPEPPKRRPVLKRDGGCREVWVYRLSDRIFLGALRLRIDARIRTHLRDSCVGGVRGRSQRQTLQEIMDYLPQCPPGFAHQVLDIEKCFDSVDRHELAKALQYFLPGEWVRRLIQALGTDQCVGLPQGNPISCLLLNLFLSLRLDGHIDHLVFYRRYIDDMVVIGDPADVARAVKKIEERLAAIGLRLNETKSAPQKKGLPIEYLGVDIYADRVRAGKDVVDRIVSQMPVGLKEEQARAIEEYYSHLLHQEDWLEQIHIPLRTAMNSRSLEAGGNRVSFPRKVNTIKCEPLVPSGRQLVLPKPPGEDGWLLSTELQGTKWVGVKTVEKNGKRLPVVDGKGEYLYERQG